MDRLSGHTIAITGAAQGQRATEAQMWAAEGARVVSTEVDDELESEFAAEPGATYLHLESKFMAGAEMVVDGGIVA